MGCGCGCVMPVWLAITGFIASVWAALTAIDMMVPIIVCTMLGLLAFVIVRMVIEKHRKPRNNKVHPCAGCQFFNGNPNDPCSCKAPGFCIQDERW